MAFSIRRLTVLLLLFALVAFSYTTFPSNMKIFPQIPNSFAVTNPPVLYNSSGFESCPGVGGCGNLGQSPATLACTIHTHTKDLIVIDALQYTNSTIPPFAANDLQGNSYQLFHKGNWSNFPTNPVYNATIFGAILTANATATGVTTVTVSNFKTNLNSTFDSGIICADLTSVSANRTLDYFQGCYPPNFGLFTQPWCGSASAPPAGTAGYINNAITTNSSAVVLTGSMIGATDTGAGCTSATATIFFNATACADIVGMNYTSTSPITNHFQVVKSGYATANGNFEMALMVTNLQVTPSVHSNNLMITWFGHFVTVHVTLNLADTGPVINNTNAIPIDYIYNQTIQTFNATNGLNTFTADNDTTVRVNGLSLWSNNNTQWCITGCNPFTFSSDNGASQVLNYWYQVNVSYRWIPPVSCPLVCLGQRPAIQAVQQFSTTTSPFLLASGAAGAVPTAYTSKMIDNNTGWNTPGLFFYNGGNWIPHPQSGLIGPPVFITINFTAGPATTACNSTHDPFTLFLNMCYVPGFIYSYGNIIGVSNFLTAIWLVFAAAIFLKSGSPLLVVTFLLVGFAVFSGLTIGLGGSAASFITTSGWQIGLIALVLALAGTVVRLFVGRNT